MGQYWEILLAEYRNSRLTIREYFEQKEVPYESLRRLIRLLKDEEPNSEKAPLGFVEVTATTDGGPGAGVNNISLV
ncbi:MAG: hypothetical protein HPZ91_08165 [Lentisphaeria bacterium]|nr:hypothetical protein [Lentisphaeria bacterium]